jgi:uncharacterized membrane protein
MTCIVNAQVDHRQRPSSRPCRTDLSSKTKRVVLGLVHGVVGVAGGEQVSLLGGEVDLRIGDLGGGKQNQYRLGFRSFEPMLLHNNGFVHLVSSPEKPSRGCR